MPKFVFRFSKKMRFISHLLASAGFIALFVWGWDLAVSDVIIYGLLCLGFLVLILAVAAILVFIWRLVSCLHSRVKEEE
jgi:hypothetical protein